MTRQTAAVGSRLRLLLLLVFCMMAMTVHADFGDYVSPVDECPVVTTCPVACVNSISQCPEPCLNFQTPCPDGTCSDNCSDHQTNPCTAQCAAIACPKSDTPTEYEVCWQQYGELYDQAEECERQEKTAASQGSFHETPFFIFFFIWMICISIAVVMYCATHQKTVVPLATEPPTTGPGTSSSTSTTSPLYVCGLCRHTVTGTLLYYAVQGTIWGIQIVLGVLTILYYVNQVDTAETAIQAIWNDEEEILQAFQVVWSIGFAWNLLFKWPSHVRSLFWKPVASWEDATHVAIWTAATNESTTTTTPSTLRRVVLQLEWLLHRIMTAIFFQDASLSANGRWTFLQVVTDLNDDTNDNNDTTNNDTTTTTKHFVYNFRRYNLVHNEFVPAVLSQERTTLVDLYQARTGLTTAQARSSRARVGPNVIEMPRPRFGQVLLAEFTKPYYTYQNFIMWSWMPLYYYYMAMVQTAVIVTGGICVCLFRYRNECSLYQLSHINDQDVVTVLRNGQWVSLPPSELVPRDVMVMAPGKTYCDLVLVDGGDSSNNNNSVVHSSAAVVLVDESALTGESTPVAKTTIDPATPAEIVYGTKPSHKRHTIQAGTTVLEVNSDDNDENNDSRGGGGINHTHLAVVTKTGSHTTKGELLRDIFSYQRHQFKFDEEVGVVVMILFFYAIIAFLIVFELLNYTAVYGWFYGMYAVASVLPPLLPTVFTVSVGVSDHRLTRQNIACTNSEEILVAGKVKRAFFDKTGTLTKQGLEFLSARSRTVWNQPDADLSNEMALGMATCHNLTRSTATGDLIGNPVDRTMFAASGARFAGNNNSSSGGSRPQSIAITDGNGNQVQILKHFDFDHHRMTQSVIVKTPADGRLMAFVKGSGESIQKLCQPTSLPTDFNATLRSSAKAGIYQISMATKVLGAEMEAKLANISRDDIEKDLSFAGVVNFKNVLRDEAPAVIRELEGGEVRCVMVTGDSVLTGVCIAKESEIIGLGQSVYLGTELDSHGNIVWLDEDDAQVTLPESLASSNIDLAITGEVWQGLQQSDPKTAEYLAEYIRVYGRCTPVDKVSVVTNCIDRGFITLMCGDGGNDCGALKTAHVGIALSDAEASIVSPFTSLDKSITSVLDVLREGRCALASALASYKFMIMYGQLIVYCNIINAYFHTTFTEWCWVFIDGVWTISLGFTLPLSNSAKTLAPTRPTSSLLGPHTMSSALGVLFIHYTFTVISLSVLFHQDWFQCRKWENDDISNVLVIGDNYETETLFLITGYQFISSAMTFNFGYEWRGSWISNRWFAGLAALFSAIHFFITLVPGDLSCLFRVNCNNENVVRSVSTWELFPIQNYWNTTEMPVSYRFTLLFIMIVNAAAVMAWDYFAVNGTRKRLGNKKRQANVKFAVPRSVPEESCPV